MQVEFYLAGEITQVIDSIPWVRCASGNVLIKLTIRVGYFLPILGKKTRNLIKMSKSFGNLGLQLLFFKRCRDPIAYSWTGSDLSRS